MNVHQHIDCELLGRVILTTKLADGELFDQIQGAPGLLSHIFSFLGPSVADLAALGRAAVANRLWRTTSSQVLRDETVWL
jgi:hypothetical protein